MRILQISDNKIVGFGGGSIENKKHYDALKCYSQEQGHELKVISVDESFCDALPIQVDKNKKIDMLVRLKGHSSFLFNVWKSNIKQIVEYNPDLVYLGRSRFGFIAKSVKKVLPDCKVITNVDNVEWDYVDAYFAGTKGIKGKLMKLLEKVVVYRDERDCLRYSDRLIYLTQRNVERIGDVYRYSEQEPVIVPICLEKNTMLDMESSVKNIVFIGSLNYASNVLAVKTLINDVWLPFYREKKDVLLTIAGRNPSEELIRLCESCQNIRLVKNFDSLSTLIPKHSLVIAPIEKGAGMKVKVAETLSMGLMIAASDEALAGYEKAVANDRLGSIMRANTPEEYRSAIECYCSKDTQELEAVAVQNQQLYQGFYSYEVSRKAIHSVCDEVLK